MTGEIVVNPIGRQGECEAISHRFDGQLRDLARCQKDLPLPRQLGAIVQLQLASWVSKKRDKNTVGESLGFIFRDADLCLCVSLCVCVCSSH